MDKKIDKGRLKAYRIEHDIFRGIEFGTSEKEVLERENLLNILRGRYPGCEYHEKPETIKIDGRYRTAKRETLLGYNFYVCFLFSHFDNSNIKKFSQGRYILDEELNTEETLVRLINQLILLISKKYNKEPNYTKGKFKTEQVQDDEIFYYQLKEYSTTMECAWSLQGGNIFLIYNKKNGLELIYSAKPELIEEWSKNIQHSKLDIVNDIDKL